MSRIKVLKWSVAAAAMLGGGLAAGTAEAACVPGNWVASNSSDSAPVRYETDHFAFRWNGDVVSSEQATAGGDNLERIWQLYIDKIGFQAPSCSSAVKYKVNVNINPGSGLFGGIDGDGIPSMWIDTGSVYDIGGLGHEFTHSLQGASGGLRESPYVGWTWESHAEWMTFQLPEYHTTTPLCTEMLVQNPHLYYGSTRNRYCNWQFWEFLKNKFGYAIVNDMWSKSPKSGEAGVATADPFSVIMKNNKWNIRRLNNEFGDWARRNVNWDYKDADGTNVGAMLRRNYGTNESRDGDWARRTTELVALDKSLRRFAVPSYAAPQRWGYNLVPLAVDTGATYIDVDFRGVVQDLPAVRTFPGYDNLPDKVALPGSDWRWSVVAIDSRGRTRYSAVKIGKSGSVRFNVRPRDKVYLVVTATPSVMQQVRWDQPYFSIYRYPWMVQFANAVPEGHQDNAPNPTTNGHRHPNGGGWVDDAATVADTAYVGPNARVLGGTVSGNARIVDHALVTGGTVTDNAEVGALSIITDGVTVKGNAKVFTVFKGIGRFEYGPVIGGTAEIRGDAEVRGAPTLLAGTYYGYVDQDSTNNAAAFTQSGPVPEVTAVPNYVWY